jgi:hypothetical protein
LPGFICLFFGLRGSRPAASLPDRGDLLCCCGQPGVAPPLDRRLGRRPAESLCKSFVRAPDRNNVRRRVRDRCRNALRLKTSGPERDTSISGHMVGAELRSLLASVTQQAPLTAISKSMDEGDDSLASAALHASRFLTGLSAVEQDHIRQQWATRR